MVHTYLFTGSDQYNRYTNVIISVIKDNEYKFDSNVKFEHLGMLSVQNKAATFVC